MKQVRAYPCPECDALYDDTGDAYKCCMDPFGVDAWQCDNRSCEEVLHREEAEALNCGRSRDCECGHMERVHSVAVGGGWIGCYDLDCRCPKYERSIA